MGYSGEVESQEVAETIYNVIESYKQHGIPVGDIEIGIEGSMAKCHDQLGGSINDDQVLVFLVPEDSLTCLLYTSPSPRDRTRSRMPSSA